MTIMINQDKPLYQTITVNRDDHLYGLQSKKYRIYATSSTVNPVINVQSTWDFDTYSSYPKKTTTIENLIIDGQGQNVTGINLYDVGKCEIQNITIKNCDIGIHFHNYNGCWTECNLLKHIRMENVNTGIKFDTDGPMQGYETDYPGDSFGFTVIDDVEISLNDISSAVGIQIGDGNHLVRPYSSLIKANVVLGSAGGAGLQIKHKARLQYGLISLNVANNTGTTSGSGIDLQYAAPYQNIDAVSINQPFKQKDNTIRRILLSTHGITNPINNPYSYNASDITQFTY